MDGILFIARNVNVKSVPVNEGIKEGYLRVDRGVLQVVRKNDAVRFLIYDRANKNVEINVPFSSISRIESTVVRSKDRKMRKGLTKVFLLTAVEKRSSAEYFALFMDTDEHQIFHQGLVTSIAENRTAA